MDTPISVEPAQAARWGLEFLSTATLTFADFDRASIVRALLLAIGSGALIVTPAPVASSEPAPPPTE